MNSACPHCNGSGSVESNAGMLAVCPHCDGTGRDHGVETFRIYVFDIVLTANQVQDNQRVTIDGSAVFRLKALSGTQTGAYRVRLRHASGEYMSSGGIGSSNDKVNNANIIGTAQFPFPMSPPSEYGASGHILIDLEDLSSAGNTIQIAFIGSNVYPSKERAEGAQG